MRRRSLAAGIASIAAQGACATRAPTATEPPVGAVGAAWRGGGAPRRLLLGHAGNPRHAPPVAADTLWRVASISKLAQALVALRLAERGLLDLDAPLGHVLGFALHHPDGQAISAHDLLTHQSGLRDRNDGGPYLPPAPLSAALLAPHWAPRHFTYANVNSIVLGTALEALSGLRYDDLLERELFAPLHIEAAFDPARLSSVQRARVAVLQRRTPQGLQAQTPNFEREPPASRVGPAYQPGQNCVALAPQGGLITSLIGLERMAEALRSNDARLFSPATHQALRQPRWRWREGEPADTLGGLFRAWASGAQCFTDHAGGDRLHRRGGLRGIGHLASAYGLFGGLVVQAAEGEWAGWAMVYLLHGATDTPGHYSAFSRAEENLMTRLLDPLLP